MTKAPDLSGVRWRKSSYSGTNGNCVDIGQSPDFVGIRDTKDLAGPVLVVDRPVWQSFVDGIKAGDFDA